MRSAAQPASGFTLVEFMLALVLGTLAMAGVWVVYENQMESLNSQKTTTAVKDLIKVANISYANSLKFTNRFDGGTTMSMAQLSTIVPELPEAVIVRTSATGVSFNNYWGGSFNVSVASSNTATNTQDLLVITLTQLPASVCNNIVSVMGNQVYDTTINAQTLHLLPVATATQTNRNIIQYGQMINLCANPTNRVVFRTLKEYSYALMRYRPFMTPLNPQEQAIVAPNYARLEAAMAARELKQKELDGGLVDV